MTSFAIALVVLSAFMHAGWNLLSKSRMPSTSFFLVASFSGALTLSPFLIAEYSTVVEYFPLQFWAMVVPAGFCMALYYTALAGAYRAGDISVAYPLARAFPVIAVLGITFLVGRGEEVTYVSTIGMVLIVAGCLLIPLHKFRELRLSHYMHATCGFALLAAIGTIGYSLIDDEALRMLRSATEGVMGNTRLALIYACIEAWVAAFFLTLLVLFRKDSLFEVQQVLRIDFRHAILTGIVIQMTYALVLMSLAYVSNVSYVVGFRQMSIPLGALAGILLFKEAPFLPKIFGMVVMTAGLVLVAIG